ncbi:hypothetical protein ACJRO7_024383 [Eucalyptus globulus]|uniref:Alpha-1,3-glucosyltransferase n=1 Tax=Eucalyptus globulus TaxID=34317 RepID=A0ABD3KHU5_EUCGL
MPPDKGRARWGRYMPPTRGRAQWGRYMPPDKGRARWGRYMPPTRGRARWGRYMPSTRGRARWGRDMPPVKGRAEWGRDATDSNGSCILLLPIAAIFESIHIVAASLFNGVVGIKYLQPVLIFLAIFMYQCPHMSAYFAPAFSSHLLGKCLRRKNPFLEVSRLGLVVIGTFAVVWWPYLYSSEKCVIIFLHYDVLTCLPSMIHPISSPSSQGFLCGLLNNSLSFYFFSFHVHEKSILLPLLLASLLALDDPSLYKWLTHYGLLSMFPLLRRTSEIQRSPVLLRPTQFRVPSLFVAIFGLHLVYITTHSPEKYPFLFAALIMIFWFFRFALLGIYTNKKQWTLSKHPMLSNQENKLI